MKRGNKSHKDMNIRYGEHWEASWRLAIISCKHKFGMLIFPVFKYNSSTILGKRNFKSIMSIKKESLLIDLDEEKQEILNLKDTEILHLCLKL